MHNTVYIISRPIVQLGGHLGRFLIFLSVMEVWNYGKFSIILCFHRKVPFPNFLVSMDMEIILREIVNSDSICFSLIFLLIILN